MSMTTNEFAPDVVYGLGGGGTELALQFLEQDWILDNIVRPRPSRSENVTVRLLDTASGEMNGRQGRIDDIRQQYRKLEEQYRGEYGNRPGSLSIDPVLVSRDITMTSATVLTGRQEVESIAEATAMDPDNWWLEREDVDENLNFADGVHRERGLAKATLYRALGGRNEVSTTLETTNPSQVAIFVGLGGGSGSGMLFDVIESLNKSNPNNEIVIFGVLPSLAEDSEGVHANAYAALGELEAMRLGDDDPVEDVVLYHLDAANYEGKEGNQLDTGIEEFDEAFCQSVIAYYGATGEDQFNRTPSFAPFTVAVPQVISYNIEAIEEARDAMESRLDAFAEAFEIEAEVIDSVQSFYTDIGIGDVASVRADSSFSGVPDEFTESLRERLTDLHDLASEELFEELEYASAARFLDAYENAKMDVNGDDPISLARQLKNYDNTVRALHEARDDLDERLGETLVAGIRRIAEQADLLVRRQALDDNRLKSAVGHLVPLRKGMRRDVAAAHANLGIDRLERNVRHCENTIKKHQQNLEKMQSTYADEVSEAVSRWENETETAREQLAAHDVSEAKTLLKDVQTELHEFSVEVEDAESEAELEQLSIRGVTTALELIEAYETRVSIGAFTDFSLVDRNSVQESCHKLIDARKTSIAMNDDSGFLSKLTRPFSSDNRIDETRRLRDLHEELERMDVYSIKPATEEFGVSITFDVEESLQSVREEIQEIKSTVTESVQAVNPTEADDLHPEELDRIWSAVSSDNDAVAVVERILAAAVGDTEHIEADLAAAESDLMDAKAQLQRYSSADDLFSSLLERTYSDYVAALDSAHRSNEEYNETGTEFSTKNDFAFRCTLQPQNPMKTARKSGLDEAALFNSLAERQTLEGALENVIDNVHNRNHHGLCHPRLTGADAHYYGTDVNIGLVSPLRKPLADTSTELSNRINNGFAVSAPGSVNDSVGIYSVTDEWDNPVGPAWDIGVHTFISGVFLDNLRAVTNRGFRQEYENITSDKSLALHHAYRLDEGTAIRRRDHVNVERAEEREFYINNDAETIRSQLLSDHFESVPVGPYVDEREGKHETESSANELKVGQAIDESDAVVMLDDESGDSGLNSDVTDSHGTPSNVRTSGGDN